MKITWNWLSEYVDLSGLTPEQVARGLTDAGIPVEWMEPFAKGVQGVVVGLVRSVRPHPDADRLRVCEVEVGDDHPLTIVCGAANVAAAQKVPVAVVGARLPGGAIGRSKLRGIVSEGMICSAGELGLPVRLMAKEQTEGIFVLPADAPIGHDIADYLSLSDCVMDLELTPNRSDCLSLRGVAYEVGAIFRRAVQMPDAVLADARPSDSGPSVALSARVDTEHCRAYAVQAVAGLATGPSPIWMQMRLLAVGVRPISILVDITNYVMFEWGQPLHAFDYAAITEGQLIVRQALPGEQVVTLDGHTRPLTQDMTVIADPEKALGLAGVMGGAVSEVHSETETVVVESALFDPLQTRRTSRTLQLRSEAGIRFEKGPDPAAVTHALARATQLICRYAGGHIASPPVLIGKELQADATRTRDVRVSPMRVAAFLGAAFTREELHDVVRRLGFLAEDEGDWMRVQVPSRRFDIALEEDMIEEFARLLGYDRIPATMIEGPLTPGKLTLRQTLRRDLRQYLLAAGLQEVWTYALVGEQAAQKAGIASDHPLAHMGALQNPISEDRRLLRSSMLFALLDVAQYNANRRMQDIRVFEIGTVFHPHRLPMDAQPAEAQVLAALLTGQAHAPSPHGGMRKLDFYDAKGIVEGLLLRTGIATQVQWSRSQEPFFHAGRAADLSVGGLRIGMVGQIRTEVAHNYDLDASYYFELDIDALVALLPEQLRVKELARFPAIERDLALVAPRALPVETLLSIVREHGGDELQSVAVFDVYTGERIDQTLKSVALRLQFLHMERTLTDEEVAAQTSRIVSAMQEQGVTLRS